ncbi:MAG: hypothetical protein P8N76_10775 [Pirellulaceae bacterium]|nr:hypothetical protein [Pirellulaceae bacterium]
MRIIPTALAIVFVCTIALATEATPRIAWYGTWAAARAEAARSNRPILLVSAAPHCLGVPGTW